MRESHVCDMVQIEPRSRLWVVRCVVPALGSLARILAYYFSTPWTNKVSEYPKPGYVQLFVSLFLHKLHVV